MEDDVVCSLNIVFLWQYFVGYEVYKVFIDGFIGWWYKVVIILVMFIVYGIWCWIYFLFQFGIN